MRKILFVSLLAIFLLTSCGGSANTVEDAAVAGAEVENVVYKSPT